MCTVHSVHTVISLKRFRFSLKFIYVLNIKNLNANLGVYLNNIKRQKLKMF